MPVRRKRLTRWLVITGTTAALAVGGWWAYQVSAAFVGTLGVPCDRAARFVRAAELPAGTHDRKCTTGQWLSISYELDFRAPRGETEAWLRASYPDAETSGDCTDSDACAYPQLPGRAPVKDEAGHRLADGVRIELDYEDGDVAHVRISGFTV
ncbi:MULTISPECIES: hypothetical protein [Streptomyces]|uniref:Lipoprotein n=1 Tax=Streptomyces virginiae TaxID=1961 RepID=A0ABZ1TGE6_STRVG|nr:hypothetical protein [Streptomyces virginiae]